MRRMSFGIFFFMATTLPVLAGAQPMTETSTPAANRDLLGMTDDASDLRERLIARFEVTYAGAFTHLTGDRGTVGEAFGEGALRTKNNQGQATLALGTRGLGLSQLNVYLLGRGGIDLDGAPGTMPPLQGIASPPPTAFPIVEDRVEDARALWLHLAYGELEGLTSEGALSKVSLRAGRQYHWGPAPFTFDGATVGYDDKTFSVHGRIGRRPSVFRTNHGSGLAGGVDASYRVPLENQRELEIGLEYVHFQRELVIRPRDMRLLGAGTEIVDIQSDIGQVHVRYDLSADAFLHGRVSFVSPELSHVRAGLFWQSGRLGLTFDLDQKVGRDLFYDLGGGEGVFREDRAFTLETFKLNIPDLQPYTDLSASISYVLLDWLEVTALPGVRLVHGEGSDRTPFDANRFSWALGAHSRFQADPSSGIEVDLVYDGVIYGRQHEELAFRGVGGEQSSHGLVVGARYVRGSRFVRGRMLGGQRVSAGIAGFFRGTQFDNPILAAAVSEGTFGARLDAKWVFSDYAAAQLIYDYAVDSNIFAPHLGPYNLLRASLEGRF